MDLSGNSFKDYALELGRSEEFIEQLEVYTAILNTKGLPVIFSPTHLALSMGKEYEELAETIENREAFYKLFKFKKKHSKGYRNILAPGGELKRIQYWIKENILDKIVFPEYVTAYQSKKSIYNNALPHVNKELIIKFDLKNYFDTIDQARVYGLFQILGYNKSVSVDLAKLCCVSQETLANGTINEIVKSINNSDSISILPQGAPSSPAISNLAATLLDYRLLKYASKHNYAYTRYADDLTFSGSKEQKLKKNVIKRIITDSGFLLNERKGSYVYKANRQLVTGLTVNTKVSVPKKKRRMINTHIHDCIRFGPYNHLKKCKMDSKSNYREWLLGNILYIYSINPKAAKKMKANFDKIDWLFDAEANSEQLTKEN